MALAKEWEQQAQLAHEALNAARKNEAAMGQRLRDAETKLAKQVEATAAAERQQLFLEKQVANQLELRGMVQNQYAALEAVARRFLKKSPPAINQWGNKRQRQSWLAVRHQLAKLVEVVE